MKEQWERYFGKNPDGYDPTCLQINGQDLTLEEYQEAYNKFKQAKTPAPFLYEDYSYNCSTVIEDQIQVENYDVFYKMYNEFLKII